MNLTGTLSEKAAWGDHAVLVDPDKGIALVADGFGGGRESVAGAVVREMMAFLRRGAGDQEITLPFEVRTYCSLAGNILCNAFVVANRKLRSMFQDLPPQGRGGASVGAAWLDGDRWVIARVGAVSAWIEDAGNWRRIIAPDTLGEMEQPGGDWPSEAHVPLSALGLQKFVEPLVVECRAHPGARLVLVVGELGVSGVTQGSRAEYQY